MHKISILGGLLAAAFFTATPAVALPITVQEGSADIVLDFNGFYRSNSTDITIPGLSAEVTLSNFDFNFISGFNITQVLFNYSIENTSTSPVLTSRVSNFAFDVTPNVLPYAPNSVNGLFTAIQYGQTQPNGIGTMEFCITGANCPGGGSGGVTMGQTGSGQITLYLNGNQTSLTFDDAVVRYQSVSCAAGSACSGSASGIVTEEGGGGEIPEPSTYALMSLGIAGIAMASRYSRKK